MPWITGIPVEPGDATGFAAAIRLLVQDRERREAMGQAARAFAQGRDWSRELDQLETIYRRARETSSAVAAPTSWPTTTSVSVVDPEVDPGGADQQSEAQRGQPR